MTYRLNARTHVGKEVRMGTSKFKTDLKTTYLPNISGTSENTNQFNADSELFKCCIRMDTNMYWSKSPGRLRRNKY